MIRKWLLLQKVIQNVFENTHVHSCGLIEVPLYFSDFPRKKHFAYSLTVHRGLLCLFFLAVGFSIKFDGNLTCKYNTS